MGFLAKLLGRNDDAQAAMQTAIRDLGAGQRALQQQIADAIERIEVHEPSEDNLPLALVSGPRPLANTNFRMAGGGVLMVRPDVAIDVETGVPGRGMTERRIAGWLLAGIENDTGIPMADVCDVNIVDHEGRFVVTRVHNHSTEAHMDLAIPVGTVSAELYQVMEMYRAGVLEMAGQAHRKNQDLTAGRRTIDQALAELERLKSSPMPQGTMAEFMLLQTVMQQARQHGARIPYAEPSGEDLSQTWQVRREDQVDGGHQVVERGQPRQQSPRHQAQRAMGPVFVMDVEPRATAEGTRHLGPQQPAQPDNGNDLAEMARWLRVIARTHTVQVTPAQQAQIERLLDGEPNPTKLMLAQILTGEVEPQDAEEFRSYATSRGQYGDGEAALLHYLLDQKFGPTFGRE